MKAKKMTRLVIPMTFALAGALTASAAVANFVAPKNAMAAAYESAYSSKSEANVAGLKLNEEICEEGMVLLKNENNALPIESGKGTNAARVSVFGYASVSVNGGGSSSGDTSGGVVRTSSDLYSSLIDAGFKVNPTVRAAYNAALADKNIAGDKAFAATLEAQKSALEETYGDYGDAAIIQFSGGTAAYNEEAGTHSLQLDKEQYDLVDYVSSKFDKVIVLINKSQPLELKALQDNDKVDAILLVGEPGDNGFDAVGKILNGEVNPSARTVDLYAADFLANPVSNNYNLTRDNNTGYKHLKTEDGTDRTAYLVQYEEGIYNGYRYYETRDNDDDTYNYDDEVVYPFGYGLSYTSFAWEVTPVTAENSTVQKDDTLKFKVKVTNTGEVAGKEVVQLYYTAPYGDATTNSTKIEKAYKVLGDYGKTDLLAPGESQTITLKLDVSDMASYDEITDKTYVLDDGTYTITIGQNSHDNYFGEDSKDEKISYTVGAKVLCDKGVTGATVTNAFDYMDEYTQNTFDSAVSRANGGNWTTTALTDEECKISDEKYAAWTYDATADTNAVYEALPEGVSQADEATRPETAALQLSDMIGKDYNDAEWETLLNELSLNEMIQLVSGGGFRTIALNYIGKPYSLDTDGPKGWTGTGTGGTAFNKFAAEPVIASTFNKELAYEMGVMIGEQGLWGNSDVGSGIYAYTGWYAPGMNLHRGYFDGRYTEYFSEDPYLTGTMVANQSLGAKSKGAFVFIKHFAMHDDGSGVGISVTPTGWSISGYRGGAEADSGLSVFANEQTMRELYLKAFQIAVEDGEAGAAMSSFSRLGPTWCGGSYALQTQLLRNEWGFKGYVVTDIKIYGFLKTAQMVRAGGDLILTSSISGFDSELTVENCNNPTMIMSLRRASKAILYTVANSHAMQTPNGSAVVYNGIDLSAATLNEAYTAELGNAKLNTAYAYSTISYEYDGDLPEGMDIDEATGTLSGTPTETGTYRFSVTALADGYESATVEYALVVSDAAEELKGIESATINDQGELVLTYTDGTSVNLGKVVGTNGTNGTDGKDGKDGKDGSGCGSELTVAGVASIAVLGTLAAVAFVALRRKQN